MIVAALEIENYKQYAGEHRLDFPEQGIVAVTGPNGSGKTTLFEAIEWCLYCPRSIPQATVPPHDGVGKTVVRVHLQDLQDGACYVVQRELRSGNTRAEVYRDDRPEEPIVQGTREVTRYVASRLIGLPHGAFVSTFFTKQKELQFFADRSATERRTEVARLLGLEAVREAQKEIGEGRSAARSRADSLREEHERRLGDRELDAEKAAAERAVTDAAAAELAAEAEALQRSAEAEQTRTELERLRELQTADAALGQDITRLAGEAAACVARRDAAVTELQRLEQRAAERNELAAVGGRIEALAGEVAGFEGQRERARRHQELDATRRTAAESGLRIWGRLEQIVDEHREAANGLTGWALREDDGSDIAAVARRLHSVTVSLNPASLRAEVEQLQEATRLAVEVERIAHQHAEFLRHRDKLEGERRELLATGDPAEALAAAVEALRVARGEEQSVKSSLAAARLERTDNQKLMATLCEHAADSVCPTCSRSLGEEEAAGLITRLEAKIEKLAGDEQDLTDEAKVAAQQTVVAEEAEATIRVRQQAIQVLDGRIADGQRMIDDVAARHKEAIAASRVVLARLGAEAAPTEQDIATAQEQAERAQRVAGLAGLLERLGDEAGTARAAEAQAEAGLRELKDADYDAQAHEVALGALAGARRAAAQVEQIDIELASQARYARQQADEDAALASLSERRLSAEHERAGLAFDPAALRAAIDAEQAAHAAAQASREAHAAARSSARDARAAQERLAADHDLLQRLIEEADRCAREADDLNRMYDEFSEFDRFVARHVGPQLAETTERMLSQVTNGKYDHVQFDENYGIEVYDGDEAFPLAGFSGGERDVVALCARLALSEVVGASAVRPPRFLVLDEVFGSLDSERRGQLLETLGALMHSGHFQQMFIISHVDDVQQSPVMHEAWTIEERDGVSRVLRPEALFGVPA